MNQETAKFVIYIINEMAERENLSTAQVYHLLEKSGCIQQYMIPSYDVLHTMGSQAIVEDILRYLKNRGGGV